jgi:hypothetical protein
VATHLVAICLQFGYNSVTEKILDKIENGAKIVNRTNVCYKEEN